MATPQLNDVEKKTFESKNNEDPIPGKVNISTINTENKIKIKSEQQQSMRTILECQEHNQLIHLLICPTMILKMRRQ
jgi:hypothetical protein